MTISRNTNRRAYTPSATNIDFEALRQLTESPNYSYLPQSTRKIVSQMSMLYPEQFAKPQQPEPPPMADWQVAQQQAQSKAAQLETIGQQDKGFLDEMIKGGYAPDIADKNIWGRLGESAKFPLQKIMSGLMAFPRAMSAGVTEGTKSIIDNLNEMYGTNYETATDVFRNDVQGDLGEKIEFGAKALPEAFWEAAKTGVGAFFNRPGEYENYSWSEAIKELYPDTKMTEEFDWTEGWEEGNFLQRMASGLAGSPADITGFALDIVTDPLTYLTGGLAKGSKLMGAAPKAVVAKGGKTIIPKGLKYAISGQWAKKFMPKVTSQVDDIMKGIAKGTVKAPITGSDNAIRNFLTHTLTQDEFFKTIANAPIDEALKYVDLGGLRFAGQTVVPGKTLQTTVLPAAKKFGELPPMQQLQQMFRPNYRVPDELLPGLGGAKFGSRQVSQETAEYMAKFTSGLDDTQRKALGEWMRLLQGQEQVKWKLGEIQKAVTKNMQSSGKVPKKLLTLEGQSKKLLVQYADELKKLTPKLDDPTKEAAKGVRSILDDYFEQAAARGRATGRYKEYFPTRYTQESSERLARKGGQVQTWGVKKTVPEYSKRYDYLTAKGLGLEPKDVLQSMKQRAAEQAKIVQRADSFAEIKKFARKAPAKGKKEFAKVMKKQGFSKVKNIDELKGWYVPDDFLPMLKRMDAMYFGDDAFRESLKVYDKTLNIWKRLALATPGYHFRNLWTDAQLGFMEYGAKYFQLRYWKMSKDVASYGKYATTSAKNLSPAAKKLMNKTYTLGGKKLTVKELYEQAVSKGVSKTGFFKTEAAYDIFQKGMQKVSPLQLSARVGQTREDITRIVPFLLGLDEGADFATSAFNVRKVFFDYTELTPTEQNIFKRGMPFYSWVRKNIARQPEMLVTQTGKYAAIPKTMKFIEDMSEVPEGYEHYKSDFVTKLGGVITPLRDPKTLKPMILNPNFAWQEWQNLDPSNLFSAMSPAIKIPFELAFDKEIFNKRPIRTGDPVAAPKPLQWARKLPQDVLSQFGMKKSEDGEKLYMSPLSMYIYNQNPTAYNIARMMPGEPDEQAPYKTLSIALGLKFWLYDEDKQKERHFRNFRAEADKIISENKELGFALPGINDVSRAYKYAYDQHLKGKYNIADIEEFENTMEMMKAFGGGLPYDQWKMISDINQQQYKEPYREEYSEATGLPLNELYQLMAEKGIELSPVEINAILDLIGWQNPMEERT